jgi:hypothetical protein
MRRATKIAAAIAASLWVAMGLWLLIAPGQLVKYPSDLDRGGTRAAERVPRS